MADIVPNTKDNLVKKLLSAIRDKLKANDRVTSFCEDRMESLIERITAPALRVEEMLALYPDSQEIQQSALSTRSAMFYAHEAAGVEFDPYWSLPLPLARRSTQIDGFFCMALSHEDLD